MKKTLYIISFLFVCLSLYSQPTGYVEMLTNGGFSDGSTGWNTSNGWSISNDSAHYVNPGSGYGGLSQNDADLATPVEPNTLYSVYLGLTTDDKTELTIRSTDNVVYRNETYGEFRTWNHRIFFTTPNDIGDGGFNIYVHGRDFSLDSVAFTKVADVGKGPYYVAIDGNDDYSGSINYPWKTWQRGFDVADTGDTVYFRGGTYYSEKSLSINPENGNGNSGTLDSAIVFMSYPGEWAILDCINHIDYYGMWNNSYNTAIGIQYAEHLTFKNFKVRNVFQLDSVISGGITSSHSRYLTFEHIIMHNIAQRGFYVRSGAWGSRLDDECPTTTEPYWETHDDTTRWINCDVYNLCDTLSSRSYPYPGNNADGWKVDLYRGNVFIWEGCRAWNYSDDGWDISDINRGQRIFNNCWAMSSNKYLELSEEWGIEGNGFSKLSSTVDCRGDYTDYPTLVIHNCIAMFCHGSGFNNNGFIRNSDNKQTNAIITNNTAYKNGFGFQFLTYQDKPFVDSSIYRNNLAYDNDMYTNSGYNEPGDFFQNPTGGLTVMYASNNTHERGSGLFWDPVSEVTVTDDDFVTTDSLELVALFTAPRNADGSLPTFPLRLAEGSDLIDAGTDVGMTYIGAAPDIGAFEYGSPPASIRRPKPGRSAGGTSVLNGKVLIF